MNTITIGQEYNYKIWKRILNFVYEKGEMTSENRKLLEILISSENIKKYINSNTLKVSEKKEQEHLNKLFSDLAKRYEKRNEPPEKGSNLDREIFAFNRDNYMNMCMRYGKNVEKYSDRTYERNKVHLFLRVVFQTMGPILLKEMESQVCYKKYQIYSDGEYYCESPIKDIVISNVKRGSLYKRIPKDLNNKSEFCYDKEGRLILHKWYSSGDRLFFYEILIYTNTQILHVRYTPIFENKTEYISKISLQTYENDLIKAVEMSYHLDEITDFIDEAYEYENGFLNSSWRLNFMYGLEFSGVRERYIYLRDKENLIYGYKKKTYYGDGEFDEAGYYSEHHNIVLTTEEYDKRNNEITPISDKKRRDTGMDAVRWHRPNYFREK